MQTPGKFIYQITYDKVIQLFVESDGRTVVRVVGINVADGLLGRELNDLPVPQFVEVTMREDLTT